MMMINSSVLQPPEHVRMEVGIMRSRVSTELWRAILGLS